MELHDLAAKWATDQMIKLFRGAHLGSFEGRLLEHFWSGFSKTLRRISISLAFARELRTGSGDVTVAGET